MGIQGGGCRYFGDWMTSVINMCAHTHRAALASVSHTCPLNAPCPDRGGHLNLELKPGQLSAGPDNPAHLPILISFMASRQGLRQSHTSHCSVLVLSVPLKGSFMGLSDSTVWGRGHIPLVTTPSLSHLTSHCKHALAFRLRCEQTNAP